MGEPTFAEKVYEAVRSVPAGRVTTYGDVAAVVDRPRAARQVGWALSALRHHEGALGVPWQRVINAAGGISARGDTVRAELQERLLEREGVRFDAAGRCDLARLRWDYPDYR